MTGGPGSGKTALIGGIVRAWRALGMAPEAIAVAAPTGKAANRIAEGLAQDGLADAGARARCTGCSDSPRTDRCTAAPSATTRTTRCRTPG